MSAIDGDSNINDWWIPWDQRFSKANGKGRVVFHEESDKPLLGPFLPDGQYHKDEKARAAGRLEVEKAYGPNKRKADPGCTFQQAHTWGVPGLHHGLKYRRCKVCGRRARMYRGDK